MKTIESEKKILYRFCLGEDFNNEYLTPREVDIAKNIILGKTAKDIAKELNISFRTVEVYVESIKSKLKCQSKRKLVELFFKSGIIYKLGVLK